MTRATPVSIALALVLLGGAPAAAQPARWDTPQAKTEAKRVLKAIRNVMAQTARQDGSGALAGVRDASWIVRVFSVVRLETLGFKGESAIQIKQSARPGRAVLKRNDAAIKAAAAFVAKLKIDAAAPPMRLTPAQAMRIMTSIVQEQVTNGSDKPATKLQLVEDMLTYRHYVKKTPRAWLALRVLALTDLEQGLIDLKAKTARKAVGKDGQPVYDWFRSNGSYLYWQPHERRFRLDLDARQAKTPSSEFRKKTPWGKNEGPNKKPKGRRQQ